MKIGYGIFMWDGDERRTRRYGSFYPAPKTFDDKVEVRSYLDEYAFAPLIGKRVRLSCIVTASRDSGHAGDAFLGLKPSRPALDETVVLGVRHPPSRL